MLLNIKALIVVLTVATAVFVVAKPVCESFMASADFSRRRNVWLVLTVTAFLSPSFWLFAIVALAVLAWAGSRDRNPAALYVFMLSIIPSVMNFQIPVVGIESLFPLNWFRILSFSVLIPAAWRIVRSADRRAMTPVATQWMDLLLIAFVIVQVLVMMPYASVTGSMRRAFLLIVDVLVLYFVVSRTCTNRRAIVETMACFTLIGGISAVLAVFEMSKGWLLYEGLGFEWGDPILFAFSLRAGLLRAQVSGGTTIVLGYMIAIAFGFWLYLNIQSWSRRLFAVIVSLVMWAGMVATYSRGPWVTGAAIFLVYYAMAPRGHVRLLKALILSAVVAVPVVLSPIGERVIEALPFVGTVDQGSVAYRQRLWDESVRLIRLNPIFGNPLVEQKMEDLRQGQGIIDLVNTYVQVGLFYGLLGLSLFVGFFSIGLGRAWKTSRILADRDTNLSELGASLVACMLGTLVMIATVSWGWELEKTFYLLAGLGAGYGALDASQEIKAPA